jgi:acetate kinase
VRVLVVNAGSSSLKVRLLSADDEVLADGDALDGMPTPDAVGHRIVHGGATYRDAVLVDDGVEAELRALTELAPLHQPKSLHALDAALERFPGVPHVACFDTAFHATIPDAAATYALPASWRERWPLRRYGFHGLSHAAVARRVDASRIVSCHLGAGASLCAIRDGRSVDTTMGFTPLEGLVMATRSGSVDPGLVLWLAERMPLGDLAHGLEHESGTLGLGGSADMRDVVAAAGLALDAYVHRLRAAIAAMAAALGGVDALVFTGGVGERSARVRSLAVDGLGFLGLAIDEQRNAAATGDAEIGAAGAPARIRVLEAREDLEVTRQTRAVLARRTTDGGSVRSADERPSGAT